MADGYTFTDEGGGVASWSAEMFSVGVVDGIIEAAEFDPAREIWDDVSVGEIDDICDGRTDNSDPTLVAMVQAADAYVQKHEALP